MITVINDKCANMFHIEVPAMDSCYDQLFTTLKCVLKAKLWNSLSPLYPPQALGWNLLIFLYVKQRININKYGQKNTQATIHLILRQKLENIANELLLNVPLSIYYERNLDNQFKCKLLYSGQWSLAEILMKCGTVQF